MIRFACPACGKLLKAPESKEGTAVSCPKCGQRLLVPESPHPTTPTATRREPQTGTTCPGCGRFIPLGPTDWSLTIECAQCAARFRPGSPPLPAHKPAPSEPEADEDLQPRLTSLSTGVIALAVVACLALVLGVVAVLATIRSKDAPVARRAPADVGRDLQQVQPQPLPPPSRGSDRAETAGGGFICVLVPLLFLYILPSLIAVLRKHQNWPAILALNLLTGWSILGWIATLVWALTEVKSRVHLHYHQNTPD